MVVKWASNIVTLSSANFAFITNSKDLTSLPPNTTILISSHQCFAALLSHLHNKSCRILATIPTLQLGILLLKEIYDERKYFYTNYRYSDIRSTSLESLTDYIGYTLDDIEALEERIELLYYSDPKIIQPCDGDDFASVTITAIPDGARLGGCNWVLDVLGETGNFRIAYINDWSQSPTIQADDDGTKKQAESGGNDAKKQTLHSYLPDSMIPLNCDVILVSQNFSVNETDSMSDGNCVTIASIWTRIEATISKGGTVIIPSSCYDHLFQIIEQVTSNIGLTKLNEMTTSKSVLLHAIGSTFKHALMLSLVYSEWMNFRIQRNKVCNGAQQPLIHGDLVKKGLMDISRKDLTDLSMQNEAQARIIFCSNAGGASQMMKPGSIAYELLDYHMYSRQILYVLDDGGIKIPEKYSDKNIEVVSYSSQKRPIYSCLKRLLEASPDSSSKALMISLAESPSGSVPFEFGSGIQCKLPLEAAKYFSHIPLKVGEPDEIVASCTFDARLVGERIGSVFDIRKVNVWTPEAIESLLNSKEKIIEDEFTKVDQGDYKIVGSKKQKTK